MVSEEVHVLIIHIVFRVTGEGGGEIGDRARDNLKLLKVRTCCGWGRWFLHIEVSDPAGIETTGRFQWTIPSRQWAPRSHYALSVGDKPRDARRRRITGGER